MSWTVEQGDCQHLLLSLAPASVDAIITDPPYGLEFMGKEWDRHATPLAFQQWATGWARLLLDVAKPGAHLVAFGGTRTFHRLACALEDAGWDIRDCLMWLYGSGFPQSLDVSKALDKAAGAERVQVQPGNEPAYQRSVGNTRPWMSDPDHTIDGPEPVTDAARTWNGWGTALKPAWEPILLARKPFAGTVAANAQEHGTGGLHIDACRIGGDDLHPVTQGATNAIFGQTRKVQSEYTPPEAGRWPPNVVLDPAAAAQLDAQSGVRQSAPFAKDTVPTEPGYGGGIDAYSGRGYSDTGGASRFFYCPKASRAERNQGLAERGLPLQAQSRIGDGIGGAPSEEGERQVPERNGHPTVKPVELMRWLVRLITPARGLVLDPFAGSGTTGVACALEGVRFLGMEREAEYVALARARIADAASQLTLWGDP